MPQSLVMPRKPTAIFLQDACYQHRYIRSRDTSAIVERPERLRAVALGLSAAMARIQDSRPQDRKNILDTTNIANSDVETDDLAAALDRMKLAVDPSSPIRIVKTSASVNLLDNPAVKFVHGDIDGDVYLENLKEWAKTSRDKISGGGSEIPEGLPQGDLYLCPGSVDAIQGAIGAVCEAVDTVMGSHRPLEDLQSGSTPQVDRAFVAIRPPGHHCGEDAPSGFCFTNNVAIGAAHAHLKHGIKRVVIFDIDLHHGNGTQSIVWQINEETYRQTLETESGGPPSKPGPQIFYGSLHDILSYPCEDGKIELVQAASVSLHGSHGQHIENVHLQTYTSDEHFWDVLYKGPYSRLLRKAEEFLDSTGGSGEDVLVFISCGFDACEHEYSSMSRHNRKVPTSFYHRFSRDVCTFSDRYSGGKVVSVLEGGYSDRALTSGAMAHLAGMTDLEERGIEVSKDWWSVENLIKLEKATTKRRGGRKSGRQSVTTQMPTEPWLERAISIFSSFETDFQLMTPSSSRNTVPLPPTSMTLRERKKPTGTSPATSPMTSRSTTIATRDDKENLKGKGKVPGVRVAEQARGSLDVQTPDSSSSSSSSDSDSSISEISYPPIVPKKIPRVILRLGPAPGTSAEK